MRNYCQACKKSVFTNKGKAKRVAKEVSRRSGERFHAYYCELSHGWHLSKMPKEFHRTVIKRRTSDGRKEAG